MILFFFFFLRVFYGETSLQTIFDADLNSVSIIPFDYYRGNFGCETIGSSRFLSLARSYTGINLTISGPL
jgi:hypothetical protein